MSHSISHRATFAAVPILARVAVIAQSVALIVLIGVQIPPSAPQSIGRIARNIMRAFFKAKNFGALRIPTTCGNTTRITASVRLTVQWLTSAANGHLRRRFNLPTEMKNDQLLERLAAISPDCAEFEAGALEISTVCRELFQTMERHTKAANEITAKVQLGTDVAAQISDIHKCVGIYPPKLRSLALQCFRLAEISERIHGKFNQLCQPLNHE
jgi:hypothetical protein